MRRPKATLSMTDICGSRAKCWNTMPIFDSRILRSSVFPSLVMSCPSSRISPAVGSMSRFMQRMRVDFPLPESPMITQILPVSMDRLTLLSATTLPLSWTSPVPERRRSSFSFGSAP